MPVTDIHTHFFPESWPDLAARCGTPDWPCIKHTAPGKAEIMLGSRVFREITSACWDGNNRLEQMDRDGGDHQIVSAPPASRSTRLIARACLTTQRSSSALAAKADCARSARCRCRILTRPAPN